MPRPKLPESEKRVREQVRIKPKEQKLALEMLEEWDFNTRSQLYRWCIMLGLEVLSGDMSFLQRIEKRFQKQGVKLEDPKQQDIFENLMLKTGSVTREMMLEGKKIINDYAESQTK